jgi:hypothetical protein
LFRRDRVAGLLKKTELDLIEVRIHGRIDLVNYDPDNLPLFVGLSVTPSVDLWSKPTGKNAGKFLQELIPQSSPAVSATPAK